jgi:hypothetical protein
MGRARSPSFSTKGPPPTLTGTSLPSPISPVLINSDGHTASNADYNTPPIGPLPRSPMPIRSMTRLSTERLDEEAESELEEEYCPSPIRHDRQLSISTLKEISHIQIKDAHIVFRPPTPTDEETEIDLIGNSSEHTSWTDEIVESDGNNNEDEFSEPMPVNSSTFWANWLDNDEKEVFRNSVYS